METRTRQLFICGVGAEPQDIAAFREIGLKTVQEIDDRWENNPND